MKVYVIDKGISRSGAWMTSQRPGDFENEFDHLPIMMIIVMIIMMIMMMVVMIIFIINIIVTLPFIKIILFMNALAIY